MRRVQQHESCDVIRVGSRIGTHEQAAVGMTNQHIWAGNAAVVEQSVQFFSDLAAVARLRPRVAPALPGAVVAAYLCGFRQLGLDQKPTERVPAAALLQNDRCAAIQASARTIQM